MVNSIQITDDEVIVDGVSYQRFDNSTLSLRSSPDKISKYITDQLSHPMCKTCNLVKSTNKTCRCPRGEDHNYENECKTCGECKGNYQPTHEDIEKLCNDIETQRLYQTLGIMDKGKSKSTPKTRWHAKGGLDVSNWIIERNPWIKLFIRSRKR